MSLHLATLHRARVVARALPYEAKMAEKLTFRNDRQLKALMPKATWYDVHDEVQRGLAVRVGPRKDDGSFRRTFVLVARFPGSRNPTRHSFGEYKSNGRGDLTLEEARDQAEAWRGLIRKGIDPRQEERRARQQADRQRDLTFGAVIEEFLRRHVKGQRKARDVEREIRTEILPHWHDRPIREITKADVVELVEAIADRPAPYHAHNVFGHIRTFFNWAIDRGKYDIEASPCDRLKPSALIGPKKPRQRVLSDMEIAAFWRAADRMGYPFGAMFQVLLLTGQRKSEVAEARWIEFELKDRLWTVPPERFKSDASHLVPLSDDVLTVLEGLPRFERGDHLFSTTFGQKPVSGFSKAKAQLDRRMTRTLKAAARKRSDDPNKIKLEPFVVHDVRRTVRTRLSALKVPTEVAELVIGHAKRGLQRVYDQHEFTDEMREALDAWANKLRELVSPAPMNVVKLEARASK
jgi:integrase